MQALELVLSNIYNYLYSNSFHKHFCKVEQNHFLDTVLFHGQGHNRDILHIAIQDLSNFEFGTAILHHMSDCTLTNSTMMTIGRLLNWFIDKLCIFVFYMRNLLMILDLHIFSEVTYSDNETHCKGQTQTHFLCKICLHYTALD